MAVEKYAKVFHGVYGLETVGLRYFNVYGPRQKCGPYSGVISIFIKCFLEDKSPMIYGEGEQSRDFVNVFDVVEANMLALSKRGVVGDVFNISSGKANTIEDIYKIVQKIMDKESLKSVYAEHTRRHQT